MIVAHLGDRGTLSDVPVPQPKADELLVRVVAAGVNPIDWKVRDRGDRAMPFVLGQDFAGVVSAVGKRVAKYREGERVLGIAREHGAYAEYTVVPEDDARQPVAKLPDQVGDADAAALPTAGLTALASIEVLRVTRGTLLLVLGATGGVGGFAVQIAKERGARVIGVAASTNEKLARSLGVDEFVAYDKGDVVEAVRELEPRGVEAVLDLVDGADAVKRTAEAICAQGRIVSTIGAADLDWFAQRKIAATNLVMADTPQSSHAGLRALLELLERGAIRVVIGEERPLAEAVDALDDSKRGSTEGKIVITVD